MRIGEWGGAVGSADRGQAGGGGAAAAGRRDRGGGGGGDGSGGGRRAGYDWRFVAAYPLPDHPGYVYWVVDDITPRRQMEQIMREEQERFVDLLENAPVGFYSADRKSTRLNSSH